MKSKYIIFLILLSFAATILISCSNKNEASSKSDSQDGGIILSDRFYAIHGVVTKIINENTVILKSSLTGVLKKSLKKTERLYPINLKSEIKHILKYWVANLKRMITAKNIGI